MGGTDPILNFRPTNVNLAIRPKVDYAPADATSFWSGSRTTKPAKAVSIHNVTNPAGTSSFSLSSFAGTVSNFLNFRPK